jgi:hypothetical protein
MKNLLVILTLGLLFTFQLTAQTETPDEVVETIDEAVDVGQELTFFLPLEELLDIEVTMQAK